MRDMRVLRYVRLGSFAVCAQGFERRQLIEEIPKNAQYFVLNPSGCHCCISGATGHLLALRSCAIPLTAHTLVTGTLMGVIGDDSVVDGGLDIIPLGDECETCLCEGWTSWIGGCRTGGDERDSRDISKGVEGSLGGKSAVEGKTPIDKDPCVYSMPGLVSFSVASKSSKFFSAVGKSVSDSRPDGYGIGGYMAD